MTGTWRNGHVVLDGPANWPEGFRVTVEALSRENGIGIRDEDWPTNPEDIARLLAKMELVEPFEMSSSEESDFHDWRRKMKESEPESAQDSANQAP